MLFKLKHGDASVICRAFDAHASVISCPRPAFEYAGGAGGAGGCLSGYPTFGYRWCASQLSSGTTQASQPGEVASRDFA